MADSGLGSFLPSETAYKDPNRFKDVLRAEGSKRASYLSSMDQFYAQLDEMERQFDATLAFKEKELTATSAYQTGSLDIERGRLAMESERWKGELGQRRTEFGAQQDYGEDKLALERDKFEAEKTTFDWLKPFMRLKLAAITTLNLEQFSFSHSSKREMPDSRGINLTMVL